MHDLNTCVSDLRTLRIYARGLYNSFLPNSGLYADLLRGLYAVIHSTADSTNYIALGCAKEVNLNYTDYCTV